MFLVLGSILRRELAIGPLFLAKRRATTTQSWKLSQLYASSVLGLCGVSCERGGSLLQTCQSRLMCRVYVSDAMYTVVLPLSTERATPGSTPSMCVSSPPTLDSRGRSLFDGNYGRGRDANERKKESACMLRSAKAVHVKAPIPEPVLQVSSREVNPGDRELTLALVFSVGWT